MLPRRALLAASLALPTPAFARMAMGLVQAPYFYRFKMGPPSAPS